MNRRLITQQNISLFIAALFVLTSGSIVSAQDYEELFAQTDDQSFGFFADEATDTAAELESLPAPDRAVDRDPRPTSDAGNSSLRSPSDLRLSDGSGSKVDRQPTRVMRLRQARARAEERYRIALLEAARWSLSTELRPTWSAGTMSNSYRRADVTYYVPVYVWGR